MEEEKARLWVQVEVEAAPLQHRRSVACDESLLAKVAIVTTVTIVTIVTIVTMVTIRLLLLPAYYRRHVQHSSSDKQDRLGCLMAMRVESSGKAESRSSLDALSGDPTILYIVAAMQAGPLTGSPQCTSP